MTKIAAIDIGTNTALLLVAEVTKHSATRVSGPRHAAGLSRGCWAGA